MHLSRVKKIQQSKFFFIRFSIEIKLKNDFKGEIASKIQFKPTDVCNEIFNGKKRIQKFWVAGFFLPVITATGIDLGQEINVGTRQFGKKE